MKPDADILIVGGGLVGPTLALALASAGMTSVVIDREPERVLTDPGFDGRAYALALSTRRVRSRKRVVVSSKSRMCASSSW